MATSALSRMKTDLFSEFERSLPTLRKHYEALNPEETTTIWETIEKQGKREKIDPIFARNYLRLMWALNLDPS